MLFGHYISHHDVPILVLLLVRYDCLQLKISSFEEGEMLFKEVLGLKIIDSKAFNQQLSGFLLPRLNIDSTNDKDNEEESDFSR